MKIYCLLICGLKLWQAWNSTTQNGLGRWTGICHAVSNTTGSELCVQLHNHRPKRDTSLARAYLLAKGNGTWRHRHFA